MRPYTAAEGAAAISRARPEIVSAGSPVAPATACGVKGDTNSRTCSTASASTHGPAAPSSTSPSANNTCTIAASSRTSVPGRIRWCSSAAAAVLVRIGSTTINRPPLARSARSRPGMSGTVIIDPLETSGLPPITTNRSVRSMSGTGTDNSVPYIKPNATCCGIWSTVLAEKR